MTLRSGLLLLSTMQQKFRNATECNRSATEMRQRRMTRFSRGEATPPDEDRATGLAEVAGGAPLPNEGPETRFNGRIAGGAPRTRVARRGQTGGQRAHPAPRPRDGLLRGGRWRRVLAERRPADGGHGTRFGERVPSSALLPASSSRAVLRSRPAASPARVRGRARRPEGSAAAGGGGRREGALRTRGRGRRAAAR